MEFKFTIIQLLRSGFSQKEIAESLKNANIKPNSLSSVEKYINQLKQDYHAKTMFHLACLLFKIDENDISKIDYY